jgi:hypothetical protein
MSGYGNPYPTVNPSGFSPNVAPPPSWGAPSEIGALNSMGQNLFGYGQQTEKYGLQALKDAFDPMGSARASGLATTMDSTNASLANSGLAGTPYGAGVSGGAAGNFANNWQTAQIGREAAGMSTATQATQPTVQGGQLINEAGQLDMQNIGAQLQAYGLYGSQLSAAMSAFTSLFAAESAAYQASVTEQNKVAQTGSGWDSRIRGLTI